MSTSILEKPVKKVMLSMIAPAAFGMLTTFMFQLVDTYFIGKLGTRELAAISFAYPIYSLVVGLFIGISTGVSSAVGKAIGENYADKVKLLITVSQLLFILITVVIGVIGYFTIHPVFSILGASGDSLELIAQYMGVLYLGMFALVGTFIANSALMAKGVMIESTTVMVIGGLVNLILDYVLIFGMENIPAMGLQGAGLATVISWLVTLVLMNAILIRKNLLAISKNASIQKIFEGIKEVITIGIPAVAAQVLNPIAVAVIIRMVSNFGNEAVAAYGIATRIESLGLTGIFALSFVLTPMASQNFGAKIQNRLDEIVVFSGKLTVYWSVILYMLLIVFADIIGSVFTDNLEIVKHIKYYFLIVGISFPAFGLSLITSSFFNGVYKPKDSLRLTLVKSLVLTIPFTIIGSFIGVRGIWFGLTIANIFSVVYAVKLLDRWLRKNNSNLPGQNRLLPYVKDFKYFMNKIS